MSTPTRPKVLLLGTISLAQETWSKTIASQAEIVHPKSTNRTSFLEECASGAFNDCLIAYRTFASAPITGRIDADLLSALPPSLKFICHNGAGYDQIDVPACSARGVRVSNVPTAVDDATADCGVFLMLGAMRNFGLGMYNLRQGKWHGGSPGEIMEKGHDPQGKTLGILGMGGIGRNMARKAHAAFGMRIIYHNRTRLDEDVERKEAAGAKWVEFEELLRRSDVLSVNLPLNVCSPH